MPPRQPDFFIVGAPKAGTTSLYYYLDQHPEIYMSPIKEPCHFSTEVRPQFFSDELRPQIEQDVAALPRYLAGPVLEKRAGGIVQEWDDYLRLFAGANGHKAAGEASVCYLWSPSAPKNIRARVPAAKILIFLRNPADRAFSQYVHGVSAGWIRQSLRGHIDANLRNRDQRFGMDFPFLELGLYYAQVKRYQATFPAANLYIGFYEDYRDRPQETLAGVLRFLEVDDKFQPDTSARHLELRVPRSIGASNLLKSSGLWQGARRLCPPQLLPLARRLAHRPRNQVRLDPKDRAFLTGYYREDVGKLAALLDRDLSHWQ
jgi:hypothetical protein